MKPQRGDVSQMVRALMKIVSGVERAKRQGDAATLATMNLIAACGQVRPSDLANELGVHQSTVTRQIQALQDSGRVDVAADPADGRSCLVSLTGAGKAELARLTEIGLSRFEAMVADWSAQEVQALAYLLTKLTDSAAKLPPHNSPQEKRLQGRGWQKKGGV